jgi:hypothetical protein
MATDREPRLTDEQVNELVFADINDPSAWGEPIFVPASKGPRRLECAKRVRLEIRDR